MSRAAAVRARGRSDASIGSGSGGRGGSGGGGRGGSSAPGGTGARPWRRRRQRWQRFDGARRRHVPAAGAAGAPGRPSLRLRAARADRRRRDLGAHAARRDDRRRRDRRRLRAQPFATIDRALGYRRAPGTRVLVHAGTYGPFSADGLCGRAGAADRDCRRRRGGARGAGRAGDHRAVGSGVSGDRGLHAAGRDGARHEHRRRRLVRLAGAPRGAAEPDDPARGLGRQQRLHQALGRRRLLGARQRRVRLRQRRDHRHGRLPPRRDLRQHFHDTIAERRAGQGRQRRHADPRQPCSRTSPAARSTPAARPGSSSCRPLDAAYEAARSRGRERFVRNGEMGGAAVAYVGCDGCVRRTTP